MGAYIKGIEIPKEQIWGVEVVFRMEKDGSLYSITETIEPTQVVEIPTSHGRMIDADALICRMDDSFRMAGLHGADYRKVKRWLKNAQTILEAEE